MIKPRNPLLSGFLSLLFPGLGHIYSGSPKRGIFLYTLSWILLFVVILSGLLSSFKGLVTFICLTVGYIIYIAVDAFLIAWRSQNYELKSYNRWYIYLIYGLFVLFVPDIIFPITQNLGFRPYNIPTGSMIPTLNVGDHLMVDMKYYNKNEINRGDIIVFELPEKDNENSKKGIHSIKRVIGIPGDKIDIEERNLMINGKKVDQKYISSYSFIDNELSINADKYSEKINEKSFEVIYLKELSSMVKGKIEYPITISPENIFVMGDNRDNSYDSRFWGLMPKKNILGKAKYVYYSTVPGRIGSTIK